MRTDILTYGGHYFNFMDPQNSEITITDIAHGLSNICRFNGHVKSFYSVAQHSVAVSLLVPAEYALVGLLHDATEAYIGDVTRPLKRMIPGYTRIERLVEKAIFDRFGLELPLPQCVKEADVIMLRTEQRDLMAPHDDEWHDTKGVISMSKVIVPMLPKDAENLFLERFLQIAR